jgi:xylulokinase
MKEGILVVDVGTSKVHTNLVDISNGSLLEAKAFPYSWVHPKEGWSEVDPVSIWNAAENAVDAVITASKNKYEIKALAFSYIGDSLLPVDKDYNPLGNIILAMDSRARQETQEFVDQFGEKEFTRITGSVVMPELVPFKIMWLRKNLPDVFNKTAKLWNVQQYINNKLGLGDATDYTMASRKILFNIHEKRWSPELCEFLKITPEMLGEKEATADSIIGTIRRFGRVDFGIDIPVMLGAHDSECGMIGLGCIPGSDAVLGNVTGTYDHVGYLVKEYPKQLEGFFGSWNGPVKDCYVVLGATIAGPNLDWFVNTFYPEEGTAAINRLFGSYDFDGSNCVFLTQGIQTGDGRLRGLHLKATLEDIFKAVIEGVTYPLKGVADQLAKYNGSSFGCMRIGGGGAKSQKWSQLKADMFGITVEEVENIEVSSIGAAIMGAVSQNLYPDLASAMQNMISVRRTFEPNAAINQQYKERYKEFLSQQ